MIELDLNKTYPRQIIACDEVGRGPLGGPVVAGVLSVDIKSRKELKTLLTSLIEFGIDDSKNLSEKARFKILQNLGLADTDLRDEKEININGLIVKLICWDLDHRVVDEENILAASLRAMKEGSLHFAKMNEVKPLVLIDGNKTFRWDRESVFEEISIIKGDSVSKLIGLSSILAKFVRDEHMKKMHLLYPQYGFDKHAGYPTKTHREAIQTYGPSPIHRKTFKGVKEFTGN